MRTEAWRDLLQSLTDSTRYGRAGWRRGDLSDTYVLARKSGSIVLRDQGYIGTGVTVEVRDETGSVVDELIDPILGHQRATFDLRSRLDEPSASDLSSLQQLARLLMETVKESGSKGEEVARRLIDEL